MLETLFEHMDSIVQWCSQSYEMLRRCFPRYRQRRMREEEALDQWLRTLCRDIPDYAISTAKITDASFTEGLERWKSL